MPVPLSTSSPAARIAADRLKGALAAFTIDDLGKMPIDLARKFIALRSHAEIAVERLRHVTVGQTTS